MDRKFNRESSKENKRSTSLQKQMADNRRPSLPEPVPDVTDLMDDWFFGSANRDSLSKPSNPSDGGFMDDFDGDSPRNSNNSRLTQEWLEEAKRIVASSPSRCDSPSRLIGSPRFAAHLGKELDRRDPLSRSARRHKAIEGFSGEILSKSAKHSRNKSENFEPQPAAEKSAASAVHQWFSNILRPHASSDPKQQNHQDSSDDDNLPDFDRDQTVHAKPPRQPIVRKSRFRDDPSATQPVGKPIPSRRTFRPPATAQDSQLLSPPKNLIESAHRRSISSSTCTPFENQVLSPPRNLIESAHRRSISSSTCSLSENQVLSPPKNLVESAHRRSISSSTCSLDKIPSRPDSNGRSKEVEDGDLNGFLKEQRSKFRRISNGESNAKAKFILSGSSNSTSSMVAAICYAWLLENRVRDNKEEDDGSRAIVVPVINMRRGRMWKRKQAAWLFHHVGIDATALIFSNEVDLESLIMARQLSILVVGQDVLKSNGEVGSQCTVLTDNYCEDAYDMLQIDILKKLLLAGILIDTQNLNASAKFSMNRDSEAVQLLLVGSTPNYRNALFDQLMQDQRDGSFLEVMRYNYGKPPNESEDENGAPVEHKVSARKSTSPSYEGTIRQTSYKNSNEAKNVKTNTVSPKSAKPKPLPAPAPAPAQATEPASRGKNKFFLAKWFGFGSK